jgi:type III pantothenate kinase
MDEALLLVDIGNSRVKWGRACGEKMTVGEAFPSQPDGLEPCLDRHWGRLAAPRAVYASSVGATEAAARLSAWVARRWAVPLRFAAAEARGYGVVNGYQRPAQLGVDRWLGLVALRSDYGLPSCLVDCGTALTLDALDAEGRHLGGLIAPGLALMKRALFRETQGIREEEGIAASLGLGRDTASCVESGVLLACAGLVEKAYGELTGRLGVPPVLALSGGGGAALGHALAVPYRLAPDLVLRGLLLSAATTGLSPGQLDL